MSCRGKVVATATSLSINLDCFAQSPEAWFETPFVNLYKLLTRILLAGVKMPYSLAHLQHYCSMTGNGGLYQ